MTIETHTMTTNTYGGYTVDQLREFIRHHYDAEHGGDNIDELTNDSSASVKIVRDLLDAIEPQRDGDLLRPVARWVYNAVRVNLDLLHGICREFGCPQGEDVAMWLRDQLSNAKSLAPGQASEAAQQRPGMDSTLMEVVPTTKCIVDARARGSNGTSSKVSRANALTDAEIWRMWCSIDHNVSTTRPILFARMLLAASPVEQPTTLTAQQALAAIETFEIVGESNDSREPNDDDRFLLHEFIAHAFGSFPVTRPSKDASRAWEYSFIHSSATDRGDTKIGPCLTYDRSIAFGVGCIEQRKVFVSATGVEQHEAAPADAIESKLRVLMGAVNAYEKATGIGGWYAERIQESCNAILKAAGSNVQFGISGENPIAQAEPQAADAREDHECVYANGDGVCRECAALAKAAQPEPPAADERAAFVKYIGCDRPETEGVAVDAWDYHRKTWLTALAYAHASSPNAAGVEGAPRYTEWLHLRAHGAWSNGVPEWARDHSGRMNDLTAASAVIEELAALSRAPRTDVAGVVPLGLALNPSAPPLCMTVSADAAAAPADARAVEDVRAWETNDGRVISDKQKQQALRDGGASASSVRPFSIALGRIRPVQAVEAVAIGEHDLSTSSGGRRYIAEFFTTRLRRHDFGRYINERLAADFACALAQYLRDQDAATPAPAPRLTRQEIAEAWKQGGSEAVEIALRRAATRPTDDQLWDQTLRERDEYHEAADKLAAAIAKHFGVDIGEHSNVNCPWNEALEVIENAVSASAPFGLTDEQRSVITQAADYLGHDQDAFALAFDLRALLKGDKQ